MEEQVPSSAFGALLRRHRLAAGLSQEALAERARMSAVGVSALERGQRRAPYRETVALLARALDLPPAAAAAFATAAADARQRTPHRDSPAPAAANNLPPHLTSFVGRQREVCEIAALVAAHRLVTLVGAGGIGKTRISLHVAAQRLADWSDGVWLVELAPLGMGEYVPSTVARAMGITLAGDRNPLDDLVRFLASKQALLVFDNCEHVIESAAQAVSAIVRGCPRVTVMASSRQALGIAGEQTYRLPSLDLPTVGDLGIVKARDALRFEAIALFVERARTVDKNFALSDDTASDVACICRQLDGIPLAIELAASRVKVLSPRQLRDRLAERFRLLTGGSRDVLPRHRTLHGLIDWSHDLLDEPQRVLFRRLSIFAGGFTLEGAASVCSDGDSTEFEILDVLASLVDKSLVLAEISGDVPRYRLLESTRAYAAEKLTQAGEAEGIADRHLRYLCDRFEALRERMERTARETERDDAFGTDLDDIRAALDAAQRRGDGLGGAALLAEIGDAWIARGLRAEGIRRCETLLETVPRNESLLLTRLATALSCLVGRESQERSVAAAAQAIVYARESGSRLQLGYALSRYAWGNLSMGRTGEADIALTEAETVPDVSTWLRVDLLRSRAFLAYLSNDAETAARIWVRVRTEQRTAGNVRGELLAALNLAEVEFGRGQTQRAIALAHETLSMVRGGTDADMLANALSNLAGYLIATDDLDDGVAAAGEAIRLLAVRDPVHANILLAIDRLSLVCALRGDLTRAATLDGYVAAAFERAGYQRESTDAITHDRLIALLRLGLDPGDLARFAAEGAAYSPEAAIFLATEER
ncbi:MAG: helix-turn-helix domain-containing protein [Candidatus Velthaea sp.]